MKFEKYNSTLNYSYVFGAFGTIELLNNRAKDCLAIIVDPSFINNPTFKQIKEKCDSNNIDLIVNINVINKIRDKGNIYVIGVFKKKLYQLENNNHIILHSINEPGIIGTIIRSMSGFNYHNLILINCNIDVFDEHLIRSTMGAFFNANILILNNVEEYNKLYNDKHIINVIAQNNKNSIENIDKNSTLMFSNKITNKSVETYSLNKDISLDNIVNIVLFKLYN